MRRLLDLAEAQIAQLLQRAADMAASALEASVRAYAGGRGAEEVRRTASELHRLHDEVTELALEAIARFSPVATDLRFLRAALFAGYDLYRIARYAYDIAAVAERFGGGCPPERVEQVARVVGRMLKDSMDMLLGRGPARYDEVKRLDDQVVDKAYDEAVAEIVGGRAERCRVLEAIALRLLERASDHTVYIAGHAHFVATGELRR